MKLIKAPVKNDERLNPDLYLDYFEELLEEKSYMKYSCYILLPVMLIAGYLFNKLVVSFSVIN